MQRKAGADGILLHTTFALNFRFGEIEYSRTDSSGKKVLNKEQYENEIRFGKEVKRQQALSLADIEGRIIDEAGNIDPEKLKEFFNELQAQGVQIMTGKNAEALLKKHNANALYLPGDTPGQPGMIVLREGADKQHIIEEIFHLKQHEQEGFRTLGASEIIDMELEAHDQMLEYARTKGWTKEEIEQLERNKAAWESDKKKYNSDVEFREKFDAELGGFKNRDDVFPDDKLNYYKRDDGEYLDVTLDDGSVVTLKRGAADQEWEVSGGRSETIVPKETILKRLPEKYRIKNAEIIISKSHNKSIGAGENQNLYKSFDEETAPQWYKDDHRFSSLASDPAHGNKISPATIAEAMAGLEAEKRGIIKGPIERGPAEIEFYDANGDPWDVKAPPSAKSGQKDFFDPEVSGGAIKKELTVKGDPKGTFPNKKTNLPSERRVILDVTYLNQKDYDSLWDWLHHNLTSDELSRVFEVKVKLD